jgi:SAM-dependent methyltransferase
MHKSALIAGEVFFRTYCRQPRLRILDVGAQDINGSLRMVAPRDAEYVGIDMVAGKGVDHVLADPYAYPFESGFFDAAVSTSCFEHDPCFWVTFLEIARVLKPGGLLYLNAPSNGPYHPHSTDNWRFYPDAGKALAAWAQRNAVQLQFVESFILNQMDQVGWNDFIAVFRKGPPQRTEAYMHASFPEASNIWTDQAAALARRVDIPEDKRKLDHLVRSVVQSVQSVMR